MRNCPGRLVATPMGMVVALRSSHSHEPYQKKMDAAGLYNEIKDLASTTSERISSTEVFDGCLAVRTIPEGQMLLPSSTFRYVCEESAQNLNWCINVYILVHPFLVPFH